MDEDIQEMFLVWRSFIFQGNLKHSPSSAAGGVALSVPQHTDVLNPFLGRITRKLQFTGKQVTVIALYPQ